MPIFIHSLLLSIVICSIALVCRFADTMNNNQEIITIESGLEVLYRYAPKGSKTLNEPAEKYYACCISDVLSRRYFNVSS